MKNKTLAIIILCAIIVLPLLFLLIDFSSVNFSLNIQKYHSENDGGLIFDFYGSFGSIHKLKISDENGKICSLSVRLDSKALEKCEDAVLVCDFTEEGRDVLLVLSEIDEDGDIHRMPFVRAGSAYSKADDTDIVNAQITGDGIICEERIFKYIVETRDDYEVPYEVWAKHTEYEFFDGTLLPRRALYVTYYSETRIYCVGEWEYNETYGELMCLEEDWLEPNEYSNIYAELAGRFKIDLPD